MADQAGPGALVRATYTRSGAASRVRANVTLDNDAYILVGHLGPDGILKVLFPADPHDDGLVSGGKTYRIPEFFAGFAPNNSSTLFSQIGFFRNAAASYDSYDGGGGYVFVVASWRPMRFDRISEDGEWNDFDVMDPRYLSDPRLAIDDLAAILTTDIREAHTVKFASYASTSALAADPLGYSAFSSMCLVRGGLLGVPRSALLTGGSSFASAAYYGYSAPYSYRGVNYMYDALTGCSSRMMNALPPIRAQIADGYVPKPAEEFKFNPGGSSPDKPWETRPVHPIDGEDSTATLPSTKNKGRGIIVVSDNGVEVSTSEVTRPSRRPNIQQMVRGADDVGNGSRRSWTQRGASDVGGGSAGVERQSRSQNDWNQRYQNSRQNVDNGNTGVARRADDHGGSEPNEGVQRAKQTERSGDGQSGREVQAPVNRSEPRQAEPARTEPVRERVRPEPVHREPVRSEPPPPPPPPTPVVTPVVTPTTP